MDAEYLKGTVGDCLVHCLAEVCEKRPADPIEYIAHWLYKHVNNVKIKEQEAIDAKELERQKVEYAVHLEALELQRLEQERIAREDAERKQAEEAELAAARQAEAALATLAEHDEQEDEDESHDALGDLHSIGPDGMPIVTEQEEEEEEVIIQQPLDPEVAEAKAMLDEEDM